VIDQLRLVELGQNSYRFRDRLALTIEKYFLTQVDRSLNFNIDQQNHRGLAMLNFRKNIRYWIAGIIVILLGIQFLPFGEPGGNPAVLAEPTWDSPETRDLFMKTCGDCHSNETIWPWYSHIAPVSWVIRNHVDEGRSKFNISEWGRSRNESEEAVTEIENGNMPLAGYSILHPDANLTIDSRKKLIDGLNATFGTEHQTGERTTE